MPQVTFKIYLDAVRINAHMNQTQWAEALSVSVNTVSSWEAGNSSPTLEQVRKMSQLSGVPMDYIFLPEKSN